MAEAEFDKMVEQGRSFGFEGKELFSWIEQERARRRDERNAERAWRKEECERESSRRNEELERQREESKLRMDLLEKEKEVLLLRTQSGRTSETDSGSGSEERGVVQGNKVNPHKVMPVFNEQRDDLDAYLMRFERVAQTQGWPRDQWSTALSLCLSGEALSVFSRMSAPDCTSYDKLKQALMLRFRLTEEGFREKFKGATPMNGETCSQFVTRLRNFLERWVELSNTKKEYKELFELIVKDQFLSGCASPLELFLKEKKDATLEEMVERAEQYVDAHGWANFSKRPAARKEPSATANSEQRGERKDGSRPAARSKDQEVQKCFLCSRTGHRAENCRVGRTEGNTQPPKCFKCGKSGHTSWKCWQKSATKPKDAAEESASLCIEDGYIELKNGRKVPVVGAGLTDKAVNEKLPVVTGLVGNQRVRVLRDTGCNTVIVRRSLVRDRDLTGSHSPVYLLDRSVLMLPEAWVNVDTPYFKGLLRAKCMEDPLYDLVLGNVEGARNAADPDPNWSLETITAAMPTSEVGLPETGSAEKSYAPTENERSATADADDDQANAVVTRSQAREKGPLRGLRVPEKSENVSRADLEKEQKQDPKLRACFDRLDQLVHSKKGDSHRFFLQGGVLQRKFTSKFGGEYVQVVVPKKFRTAVLELAHDGVMGGHQGTRKTVLKVQTEFYWPGLQADAKRFVASCDSCQRTTPRGHTRKAPLVKVPVIETPFQRVAIDIVGPLNPKSAQGNRYVLTMVDYATRYPDAVALPSIETERVAEALVEMFSRVGVPREVLSDRGTNFTSDVMKEVSRLLSIKQLHTTPYHPMANGLVERFNGTLKQMLKRMCQERPRDWDRYLAPLLFAYREVPQESLQFSPFELLYGRNVRGPLAVLRELWTNDAISDELRTTYEYVLALRERLEHTCKLAHEELQRAGERYGRYYNLKSRRRSLKPADQALILLPTENNKLLMQWRGPYTVLSRKGDVNYEVDLGHSTKVLHINMLKKYHRREENPSVAAVGAVVSTEEADTNEMEVPQGHQTQTFHDVSIGSHLTTKQKVEIRQLLQDYEAIFSDLPGRTKLTECKLRLRTEQPVNVKQYPLPFAMREIVEEEIASMLQLGIVERSESAYNSPLVVVRKPDGTHRLCVDFRRVNEALIDYAEPIPRSDELLATVGCKYFFSKLDFAKGYWQVPLSADSKAKTAFTSGNGHFQFSYMPFGIKTAPAVFTGLMRDILSGLADVAYYYDDVLIASTTWEQHCEALREVFRRIQDAGLTVKPAKCELGMSEVSFLGHQLRAGEMSPLSATLEKIQNAPRPGTKKQVRSFLGLTGYYRDFIPGYATLTCPLSDLTRKGQPTAVHWGSDQEEAFVKLKNL